MYIPGTQIAHANWEIVPIGFVKFAPFLFPAHIKPFWVLLLGEMKYCCNGLDAASIKRKLYTSVCSLHNYKYLLYAGNITTLIMVFK